MSLVDQSQQWFPTSVQVTVHQARGLRAKGKSGTNDAYAIIQVAKDKFSTSVAEKSVAPVWKEEAAFDLPLFHPGNADRCTLYIIVMHRAQVGLDKFLGQAVVNLLELHDNKSRKKTDWHKLVDKTGKEDKVRGEVLLDIAFMRNNMSASMMDLSMGDKPRSRISKLKDKVRGKKKDGFSDSASAIVPSVSQVLTDSEGEFDSVSLNQGPEGKKKSKLKKLFAPKSNLQKNVSQSMSTLGNLPEKNSFLSGSRSSGLNVDSPEGKKKFKFLGHKRTGSSDSKVSQGPFSLLSRSKHSNSDLNNLCINGSHVYDEGETKSGSTVSLNSSGPGSVEDISKHASEASNRVTVPSFRLEPADAQAQQRHRVEEEEKKQAEERRLAEARRLEEEERYRAEMKRQQEEEERRRQEEEKRKSFLEEEAKVKRQKEEEERLEEERRRQEEQKKQEEASMSERLSSLFGMIKKKEEKKEEVQHGTKEESPTQTPEHLSHNPFEDIPLGPDPALSNTDNRLQSNRTQQTPSAMVFLNRTAKVSAVKPRLTQTSDSTDPQISSEQCPSPDASDSTFSSVPAESPENFSSLHFSLAPTDLSDSPPSLPQDGVENLSPPESSPTMADLKRRAPQPPVYPAKESQAPVRQINNPAYVEPGGSQQGKKLSVPLPDYETLFPQKRHGVQGQTRWDHIIAEVNQKHRETPELLGPEMSVDGPNEFPPTQRSSLSIDRSPVRHSEPSRPTSTKKVAAPPPPKSRSVMDSIQRQSQSDSQYYPAEVPEQRPSPVSGRHSLSDVSADRSRRESPPPKPTRQFDDPPAVIQRKASDLEAPKARPRQRVSGRDLVEQEYPAARLSDESIHNPALTSSVSDLTPDPFPSTELLSNNLFNSKDSQKAKDKGMSPDDLDKIFSQEKTTDPFSGPNSVRSTNKKNARETEVYSKQSSYAFIRNNSLRQKQIAMSEKTSKTPSGEPAATLQTIDLNESPTSKAEEQMQFHIGGDPSSDLQQEVLDETASLGGNLSVGKSPLRAWVSPSEAQPISTQNSSGGGVGVMSRRPHPVKPMESPHPNSTFKEIKVQDASLGKFKMSDPVGTGPYTQLTQEELITLVVKQQADLSRKDAKITELEEYIDNLLVRVIEEQPSILQSLATKPV
ncbi:uncharacterized protein rab11fip1a [Neosynchiropus ocellatus]